MSLLFVAILSLLKSFFFFGSYFVFRVSVNPEAGDRKLCGRKQALIERNINRLCFFLLWKSLFVLIFVFSVLFKCENELFDI